MQIARRIVQGNLLWKFRTQDLVISEARLFTSFQSTLCPPAESAYKPYTPRWGRSRVTPPPGAGNKFRPRGPRVYAPVRLKQSGPNGTMVLDSPEFRSCFTPELKSLAAIFTKHGYELRIAGGAVRDMLMGKKPHDIDFATNATPDQMKAMFAQERVRTFNEKGEKHGTVCARVGDKENFEITTLRIDVATDGRHAEVQFTEDWKVDANRRDLTVNSMFLGLDGTLYDYFNGYEDLKNGVCAFVGDPESRIQEDYLRILRYFRFFARICKDPHSHKEQVLDAIKRNLNGLTNISGERIWTELSKILSGAYSREMTLKMIDVGLAPYMGLPDNLNVAEFNRVLNVSEECHPMTKIAALLHSEDEMLDFHKRVKLSAYERDLGIFIIQHRHSVSSDPHPLRLYQNLLLFSKLKANQMREYINELLRYKEKSDLIKDFQDWRLPPFPLNGNIVRQYGTVGGKDLGVVIQAMKQHWSSLDFKPTREELLKDLPKIMSELGLEPTVPPGKHTKD
uniref:CCA tRNA nucleotidyltransferase 1, mitochondrial n=2 Tax=Cacopsylla melanoneura TaxID=428564 RepID=A0A8D8ZH62_9HEMI